MITSQNLEQLLNLVGNAEQDDLSANLKASISANNPELAAAIERKKAKQRQEALEAVADVIMEIEESAEKSIHNTVLHIRALRLEQKRVLARLHEIKRAISYARETMNYIPLANAICMMDYSHNRVVGNSRPEVATKVPDTWVPAKTDE